MTIRVKLDDIIDGLESQSDESSSFLNKKTGEVVLIIDEELNAARENEPIEDFPDWQQDQVRIAKEIIAETGDYISLPTKFDIDEYRIMERFCLSLDDPEMSDLLYGLIKGSGAFRRFKDAIHKYEFADEWYSYRNKALKEIAIEWCQENGIEFQDE
ncbi:MAG TPA: hypothetical protein DIU00_15650 [Phycisphaerales bacterium]|nr:hypothetical protein [Phycisphaerales bacterium]